MMNKLLQITVWSVLFQLLFSGCSESSGGHTEIYPQIENFSYADRDHIMIEKGEHRELPADVPREARLLQRFILASEQPAGTEYDYLFRNGLGFNVMEMDDRFIMLHMATDKVVEFDPETGQFREIAERGRGPGFLMFVKDIQVRGDTLFVFREDLSISAFDCSQKPCEYDRMIPVGATGHSFAVAGDQFAISAQRTDEPLDGLIYIADRKGEHVRSFGEGYLTNSLYLDSILSKAGYGMIK